MRAAARSRLLWGVFWSRCCKSRGGGKVFEAAMKVLRGEQLQAEQTFLLVRWEAAQSDEEAAGFEATLCRHHREAVWLRHSNLTGCGRFGDSCDLCEGRPLMRA